MARFLFLGCLCALARVFLWAQTLEERVIYVPPVVNSNANASDAQWFTDMARMEVPARGFTLGQTEEGAQYTLRGSLISYTDAEPWERLFALRLSIVVNETGSTLVQQELTYASVDEATVWFPVILFTMLSNIPPAKIIMPDDFQAAARQEDRRWQNKWLYLGACVKWNHRRYIHGDASSFKDGMGGRVFIEGQLLNFLALEVGGEAARDAPRYAGEPFAVYILQGYAALKGVIKPSEYLMFEPYGGVAVNFPFSYDIVIPSLSWIAGAQLGMKVGPGCLFVDANYSQDFVPAAIKSIEFSFNRQMVNVGLGYKLGFFDRKKK
jgi:hypothetical protein